MNEIYSHNTYIINETDNMLFVFEVILKKYNNKTKIIRKIKKSLVGNLISIDDDIYYEDIKRIIINFIDVNNQEYKKLIDININHEANYSKLELNNLYIELNNKFGFLESNYNIIKK
jgi:hypothetical protein